MALVLVVGTLLPPIALVAWLVRSGFRDGDDGGDVRVEAHVPSRAGATTPAGAWVQVAIANPPGQTALVGLRLRRTRRPRWLPRPHDRRAGGRRVRPPMADWMVGAIAPGATETFWLWSDGDSARSWLEVAAGTTGRLRVHRVPVAAPPAGARIPAAPSPAGPAPFRR